MGWGKKLLKFHLLAALVLRIEPDELRRNTSPLVESSSSGICHSTHTYHQSSWQIIKTVSCPYIVQSCGNFISDLLFYVCTDRIFLIQLPSWKLFALCNCVFFSFYLISDDIHDELPSHQLELASCGYCCYSHQTRCLVNYLRLSSLELAQIVVNKRTKPMNKAFLNYGCS